MPVIGLPTILESIINSILMESSLTSYKVAANQERTTLVLRFDSSMDTRSRTTESMTVDPQSKPSPVLHSKPSIHSQQRREQYEKKTEHRGNYQAKRHETEKKTFSSTSTPISDSHVFDSAISIEGRGVSKIALSPLPDGQMESPNVSTSIVSFQATKPSLLSAQPNKKKTTTQRDSSWIEAHRRAQHDVCLGPSRPLSPTQTASETNTDDDEEESDASASESGSNSSHESDESDSKIDDMDHKYNEEECKRLLDYEMICTKMNSVKRKAGEIMTQENRNDRFDKLIEERRTTLILVNTDDLIIEYCTIQQKITNFVLKKDLLDNDDISYQVCYMSRARRRQIVDWDDDTNRINQQTQDNIKNALKCLKSLFIEKKSLFVQ